LFAGDPLPRPYVVKPVNEGSSVGVVIVGNDDPPLDAAAAGPWRDCARLLVEEYIPGRELSAAVLDDEALGVIELAPTRGFYDYEAKYTDGVTRHAMPAPIDRDTYQAALKTALAAHRAVGCRGVSRADFRYDDTGGTPGRLVLLEINTQPGMTPLSLVPEIAAHRGLGFDQLVARLLADAAIGK
ncbi:MAG: D-alanine--D-alanine ligase, partial [Alphaproteobacteria bacterium]